MKTHGDSNQEVQAKPMTTLVQARSSLDTQALSNAVRLADGDSASYPINEELWECAIYLSGQLKSNAPLEALVTNTSVMRGAPLTRLAHMACSLGEWRLARRFADFAGDDFSRADVLSTVLTEWAKAPVGKLFCFASKF